MSVESQPNTAADTCPVIYAALDEATVISLATGLHDQKCRAAGACPNRRNHAMDCFGDHARNTLMILARTPWPAEL